MVNWKALMRHEEIGTLYIQRLRAGSLNAVFDWQRLGVKQQNQRVTSKVRWQRDNVYISFNFREWNMSVSPPVVYGSPERTIPTETATLLLTAC